MFHAAMPIARKRLFPLEPFQTPKKARTASPPAIPKRVKFGSWDESIGGNDDSCTEMPATSRPWAGNTSLKTGYDLLDMVQSTIDKGDSLVRLVKDGEKWKMCPDEVDPTNPEVIILSELQSLWNNSSPPALDDTKEGEEIDSFTACELLDVETRKETRTKSELFDGGRCGSVSRGSEYRIASKTLYKDDKVSTKFEVNDSNRTKWEPLEDQLYLLRDNMKAYIQPRTYNVAFSTIDPIIKETRTYVCSGVMSPRLGATRVMNYFSNLLLVHQMESEYKKETHLFDDTLLGYIETTLANMKECVHTCGYYRDEYGQERADVNLRGMLDDVPEEFYDVRDEETLYPTHPVTVT